MKKYFGWLLAGLTSFSLVSAFADAKVANQVDEEENIVEEVAPTTTDSEQVAAVVDEEEEVE